MSGLLVLVALLCGASFVAGAWLVASASLSSPRRPECRRCGYDLTSQVGRWERCPECGTDLCSRSVLLPGSLYVRRSRLVLGLALMLAGPLLCLAGGLLLGALTRH